MKKTLVLLAALLLFSVSAQASEIDLFVWRQSDLDLDAVREAGVTQILLQYSNDTDWAALPQASDISYSLLDGGPDWGESDMRRFVQKAAASPFPRAVLDCEGWYTRQSPTRENWKKFVNRVSGAYETAREMGVRLSVCIPYWTDRISKTHLERLIREGCDEIIIMNYAADHLIENVQLEVELCQKYQKACHIALQIHPPEADNADVAYWAGGMDTLNAVIQQFRVAYGDDVGFSIHHAGYLKDFLTQ